MTEQNLAFAANADAAPFWWSDDIPELIARREPMPDVDKYQSTYIRYKCQAEAAITQTGWDLTTSQEFHDQLTTQEQQAFLAEDNPLFNGGAPVAVNMRIYEGPAEWAVPVKQDRRLTPNFKIRVEVRYKKRVSFPLTLKAYIVTQQEKDSLTEWVPDDFLDPDLPQRKPVTELKGTTFITHQFEHGSDEVGGVGPMALTGNRGNGESSISIDYDFTNLELLKPTRMNRVYIVFAASILDQDLMFVSWNIPTVGICRAEQRGKACQKLGITYGELGPSDPFYPPFADGTGGVGADLPSSDSLPAPVPRQGSKSVLTADIADVAQLHQPPQLPQPKTSPPKGRKRSQPDTSDRAYGGANHRPFEAPYHDPVPPPMVVAPPHMPQHLPPQFPPHNLPPLLHQPPQPLPPNSAYPRHMDDPDPLLAHHHAAANANNLRMVTFSRNDLRRSILEQYQESNFARRLSPADMQALESQAGFPYDSYHDMYSITHLQWEDFLQQFDCILQLLRQIRVVWDLEEPCVIAGFDMDRMGTVEALAAEPAGTFICRFSMSQPGCLVLTCKVPPGNPNADLDSLVHAIIKIDDLYERRVDTWIRDFAGATHVLDVYTHKRIDKRKVFASSYTSLRNLPIMDSIDGYQ